MMINRWLLGYPTFQTHPHISKYHTVDYIYINPIKPTVNVSHEIATRKWLVLHLHSQTPHMNHIGCTLMYITL